MATPTPPVTLTVRRLMEEPGLGLTVVEAGDLDAVVTGAHAIEIAHPERWLRPGDVMLTTGMRFAGRGAAVTDGSAGEGPDVDEEAAVLVEGLHRHGIAALLFGVGVHVDRVPAALVAHARRHRLPVIEVARETPFALVEDVVRQWTASAQSVLLERTVRVQDDLLRALGSADPVASVVGRLAAQVQGSAVLYDSGGRVLAAAGDAPQRLMWDTAQAAGSGRSFTVGRWRACSREIDMPGGRLSIAVASRSADVVDEIGSLLTRLAGHVLAAASGIRSVTLSHERAEASRLMATLTAGVPGVRVGQTWARLRPFRIRAGSSLRMVVAAAGPGAATGPRPVVDDLLELARDRGVGVLLDAADLGAGDPMLALVAEAPDLGEWLDRLARDHVAGVSEVFADLILVPARLAQARALHRLARDRFAHTGRAGVLRMDEADLASWVAATRDDEVTTTLVERQLAPLEDAPLVRQTLVAYLAHDQRLKPTAEALFVHVNTVRYRLGLAERLLGAPVASAATVTNLYLALQDEVIAARQAIG